MSQLSRPVIRRRFEQRFTARRMAEDYLDVYHELIEATAPTLKMVRLLRIAPLRRRSGRAG